MTQRRVRERDYNEEAYNIYRFRKQRGVNLGGWFVLDPEITPELFQHSNPPGRTDHDVASLPKPMGKQVLEFHWDTWMTPGDWKWIADHGYTTVRLPFGFHHVCGIDSTVLQGTDFFHLYDEYRGAWFRIIEAISSAEAHGLGILLDLHCAPGKQNFEETSGSTGSLVRFFGDDAADNRFLVKTKGILQTIMMHTIEYDNIIGIELLNAPIAHSKLIDWYTETIAHLRSLAFYVPLYIHDSWNPFQLAELVGMRKDWNIVDHHLFRHNWFGEHARTGDGHASDLLVADTDEKSWLKVVLGKCRGNIVIGSWSARLDPMSMGTSDVAEQDRQKTVWARSQLFLYEKYCPGWFFWTLKKSFGWDTGSSLKDATSAGIMPKWHGFRRPPILVNRPDDRRAAKALAMAEHERYCKASARTEFEHWRFLKGYECGWYDQFLFFSFKPNGSKIVSEIGFFGEWTKKRRQEHISKHRASDMVWEFDRGLFQGVMDARAAFFKQCDEQGVVHE